MDPVNNLTKFLAEHPHHVRLQEYGERLTFGVLNNLEYLEALKKEYHPELTRYFQEYYKSPYNPWTQEVLTPLYIRMSILSTMREDR
jgi:hypothetical protein